MDALSPPASVLVKLGSIARHVDEYLSPTGHPLDIQSASGLIADPEVREWMQAADALALLPVPR